MARLRPLIAAALVAAAVASPARATTAERRTLYFHSATPVGNVDEALAFGGQGGPPWMDEMAPDDSSSPRFSTLATSSVANDESEGNLLLAYWRGRVSGVLSNIAVTFWGQDPRSSPLGYQVQLHVDGADKPIARVRVGPAGPTPTRVVASFGQLSFPVGGALTVQFVAISRNVGVYYDSADMPSNITFDVAPIPPLGSDPRIDGSVGRVTPNPDGSCRDGDELCARMMALRSRSHVVIALVDTGVNPYHVAYRRSGLDVHPSGYIEGYPQDAPALVLTTNATSYGLARGTDDPTVWSQVQRGKLYWVPGTNIIGAISISEQAGGPWAPRPIVDDHGHGTGVSSVAAGGGARASDGRPFGSNPDALIVVVEGFGREAIEWVRSQPWIDFVSGSYGDPRAQPQRGGEDVPSRAFVLEDGRTACFSAGNGLSRTGLPPDRWSSIRPTSGPSWVVTVGASSPNNGQDYWWHSVPVDVVSYGNFWPAAAPYSIDGEQVFSGTSSATPIVCGVFSSALLEARRALNDVREGLHDGAAATGTPLVGAPMLADGRLTRLELQDAVFKTAQPEPFDPSRLASDPGVYPTTPVYYAYQGYGVVNVASGARAIDVVLGRAPLPARDDVDLFMRGVDAVRDTFYPTSG